MKIIVSILTLADSCIPLESHIIHSIIMVTIGIAEHNLYTKKITPQVITLRLYSGTLIYKQQLNMMRM